MYIDDGMKDKLTKFIDLILEDDDSCPYWSMARMSQALKKVEITTSEETLKNVLEASGYTKNAKYAYVKSKNIKIE